MKKIIFAASALALLATVSCQKELTEGGMENPVPQITKIMSVDGNEWIPETDTKTAYTPGTGIEWTGNETFAIYYGNSANAGENATTTNKYMQQVSDVTPTGDNSYSFTHPAIDGAETYDYCVITPALATTGLQGSGLSATFKLSPVQTPGANTYDPNYDILFGQGALGVAPTEELNVTRFKRITAPLRLSLSDGAGIVGDEKVYSATVRFSQAASGLNGMAGTLYLNFGYEYDDCIVNSITAPSSSITAVYADGLAKDGGIWPVWYSVSPATFDAGTELTVTVTTETKTITRTISLASAASIKANILNDLPFDISGEGYSETESLYWDFTELSGSLSAQQTASDGNPYNWGFTSCSVWNGNDASGLLPSSLRANANGGLITLPSIAGRQISKIRLYAHPNNTTANNTVSLNGGEALHFESYAVNADTGNSGVLEITVPDDQYGEPLVLAAGANFLALNGISVELVEGAALPEADGNDYYDLFTKGYDIEINGEVYNNSGYTARLIKATELQQTDLQADAVKSGILFIDPTDQSAPVELSAMTPGDAERVIMIGRYKDSQPQIKWTGQYKLRGPETIFKNINMIAGNGTSMINADAGGLLLSIEDCTLDITGSKFAIQDIEGATISNVKINNSIIEFGTTSGSAVFAYNSSKTTFQEIDFSMTNSVVYAESPVQAFAVNMGDGKEGNDKFDGYNANLNVSGNTFYNIWQPNIVVRGQVFRNFTVERNVASYNSSDIVDKASYFVCAYKSAETFSVSYNYLFTTALSGSQWTVFHSKSAIQDGVGNSRNAETNPYNAENVETGYFPINASVVTSGAGADYDTKYWVKK